MDVKAVDIGPSPSRPLHRPPSTAGCLSPSAKAYLPHSLQPGCRSPPFAPYPARVPWHTGLRAFLSHLFPKYGLYCGPNWSSGKSSGSLLWDKPPIDWLDYCCYCHDIGYDSYDQSNLYKADLAFLDCLENMPKSAWSAPKGNALIAGAYRTACITGLRIVLLPYRRMLLQNAGAKKH